MGDNPEGVKHGLGHSGIGISLRRIRGQPHFRFWRGGEGLYPIRIKLNTTSLDQLLADEVVDIRKAVQIRHLPRNQLPRREPLSLLLEQPF